MKPYEPTKWAAKVVRVEKDKDGALWAIVPIEQAFGLLDRVRPCERCIKELCGTCRWKWTRDNFVPLTDVRP